MFLPLFNFQCLACLNDASCCNNGSSDAAGRAGQGVPGGDIAVRSRRPGGEALGGRDSRGLWAMSWVRLIDQNRTIDSPLPNTNPHTIALRHTYFNFNPVAVTGLRLL